MTIGYIFLAEKAKNGFPISLRDHILSQAREGLGENFRPLTELVSRIPHPTVQQLQGFLTATVGFNKKTALKKIQISLKFEEDQKSYLQ